MADKDTELFETAVKKLGLGEKEALAARELILLNPDVLIAQYKDSGHLSAEAEQFAKDGNMLVAENRYASASKLALYENKSDLAKKFLEKSVAISKTDIHEYRVAQANFDAVSKCVVEFYRAKYGVA